MGGKGGSSQDVTQTTEPWPGIQPYLRDIYGQAAQNFANPPQYFPDATYTPFSPQTETAINMQTQRAMAGNPLMAASQRNMMDTAQGAYLNSNPYLDATYAQAMRGAVPAINSTFGAGGRTGSNAHTQAFGQTAADLATDIYGQNYQAERARQMQAGALAPTFAANDWQDIQGLYGAGGVVEGKANQVLQDRMNRYNYYQGLPEQQLNQYAQVLYGFPGIGGYGTQTTSGIDSNPVMGALGGGTAGYMLANAARMSNPWLGAGIGAGLGLFI